MTRTISTARRSSCPSLDRGAHVRSDGVLYERRRRWQTPCSCLPVPPWRLAARRRLRLCSARRGRTAARPGRAGGDGDAFAVVEQLERVSVEEVVGRCAGAHVDAQPPTPVEQAEREPGQSRRGARGGRPRIAVIAHAPENGG